MITPFDVDGEVALDALDGLARRALDDGAAGLVALGTTGEPAALTPDEQRAVVDVVAQVCRERSAALIVGANTPEALHALSDRTEITAALSLVPPFLRPGEAGVIAHFEALTTAVALPVIVYHIPYRTGQPLSVATLRTLAALPGVVGVKYATGAVDVDTVALLAEQRPDFAVLCGDDPLLSPMLALGACGGILSSAHVLTSRFVELVEAWQASDVQRARSLGHRLAALSAALFAEPNPTVVKAVLHAQGRIPTPAVRLPLLPAAQESVDGVLGLLDATVGARH